MFLHSSTSAVSRLLSAAPGRAVVSCSLHTRWRPKGCSGTQCQGVGRGTTLQQARQHLWSRLQGSPSTHQAFLWRSGSNAASYSTANTSSEFSKTTSKPVFTEASNATEGDEVDLEALVELEVELYRQEGYLVPSKFSPREWQDLLTLPSVNARKKFLLFLFKNEKRSENQRKIKELNKEKREEEHRLLRENSPQEGGHIDYGLWKNSIFLKVFDASINHFYHCRVVQAMLHGQPLVVDLDYEEHMSRKERQNCAYQLQMMMSANRKHQDPYSLELHNAPQTQDTMARLLRYVPTLYKPEFPVVVNPDSYLEKYPRERLVYLTPHCREELITYDHNAVYIIGGIVDKSSGEPLSLAKAKREGIRMKKLPLDRYLSWKLGNKCLTLNQTIEIMLDFKMTGDWPYALRHVPRRKLQGPLQSQQAREKAILRRIQERERDFKDC